jgi:hypothetical protein
MTSQNLRSRVRRTLLSGLALSAMIASAQVVSPPEASARCVNGTPVPSTLGVLRLVIEQPSNGTCNRDNVYNATVRRGRSDVARVEVWIQNGGIWSREGVATGSQVAPYDYRDNNSNSYMTLCWYYSDGVAHCGWGENVAPERQTPRNNSTLFNQTAYHGVNSGF